MEKKAKNRDEKNDSPSASLRPRLHWGFHCLSNYGEKADDDDDDDEEQEEEDRDEEEDLLFLVLPLFLLGKQDLQRREAPHPHGRNDLKRVEFQKDAEQKKKVIEDDDEGDSNHGDQPHLSLYRHQKV